MSDDNKKQTKTATKSMTEALIAFHETGAAALKSGKNPHFRSSYATLEEVINTCRAAGQFGLTFTQSIDFTETAAGQVLMYVNTTLLHTSGEHITSRTLVLTPDMSNPQKMGSGITYAKRYGLQSMFGLPSEDDDGNAAASKEGEVRNNVQSKGAF